MKNMTFIGSSVLSTLLLIAAPEVFAQSTFINEIEAVHLAEVQETPGKDFISVGWYGDGSDPTQSIFLVKFNEYGDSIWTRRYREYDQVIAKSIDVTDDGGYIIAGYTYLNETEGSQVYLIRTDSNGDTLWTKKVGHLLGGEGARMVRQTSDGGFIITGESNSYATSEYHNIYVLKVDANGNYLWSRSIGDGTECLSHAVCETSDGGYVVSATIERLLQAADQVLIKFSANGDSLWTKCYDAGSREFCWDIKELPNSNLVISSTTQSYGSGFDDAFIWTTDSQGEILSATLYGTEGRDKPGSIVVTNDGGFIIAGVSYLQMEGSGRPWVMKVDSAGSVSWSYRYKAEPASIHHAIQSSDGGFVTVGYDYQIMKLSPVGTVGDDCWYDWPDIEINTPQVYEVQRPITIIERVDTAYSTETIYLPGLPMIEICSSHEQHSATSETESIGFNLFPNPADENITVELEDAEDHTLEIISHYGQNHEKYSFHGPINRIDISHLDSGVYLARVSSDKSVYQRKIVVLH